MLVHKNIHSYNRLMGPQRKQNKNVRKEERIHERTKNLCNKPMCVVTLIHFLLAGFLPYNSEILDNEQIHSFLFSFRFYFCFFFGTKYLQAIIVNVIEFGAFWGAFLDYM